MHSRVAEAISLAGLESEIANHASAVVGHILYYLMEYSLLRCESAEARGKRLRSYSRITATHTFFFLHNHSVLYISSVDLTP